MYIVYVAFVILLAFFIATAMTCLFLQDFEPMFYNGIAVLVLLIVCTSIAPEGSFFNSVKQTLAERSLENQKFRESYYATKIIKEIDGCKVYEFWTDKHYRRHFVKCENGTADVLPIGKHK